MNEYVAEYDAYVYHSGTIISEQSIFFNGHWFMYLHIIKNMKFRRVSKYRADCKSFVALKNIFVYLTRYVNNFNS